MNSSTTKPSSHSEECQISCDFKILQNSDVFRSTNPDVVKLFAYLAKRKKFIPGDQLIINGKVANRSFLLLAGEVEITTFHHGKEVVIQRLKKGAFFGELALLAKFKWFFNARATTDCEVMIIERECFEKVLEKYPEKRKPITERIVQFRVERLTEQTEFMLDMMPPEHFKESSFA